MNENVAAFLREIPAAYLDGEPYELHLVGDEALRAEHDGLVVAHVMWQAEKYHIWASTVGDVLHNVLHEVAHVILGHVSKGGGPPSPPYRDPDPDIEGRVRARVRAAVEPV